MRCLDSRRDMTVRFREQPAKDAISRTFSDAATLNSVTESLVRRVLKEHTKEGPAHYTFALLSPPDLERRFRPILTFMRNSRWHRYIFTCFDHPHTNAYIEAVNGLIDQINRSGRGYDLTTLRAKALLRYGDVTSPLDEVA